MINVEIIGRLGADSEIRNTKNDKKMVTFRLATDDFVNGERTTTWINVMYGGNDRALKMQEHLKKGSHVNVRGILRTSLYDRNNGEKAISHDVFADRVDFVSSGSGATQSDASVSTTSNFGQLRRNETPAPAPVPAGTSDSADDLPF